MPPRAYLDANLFLHARDPLSSRYRSASLCLRELIQQGVELNVSPLVFDELWWGLFKLSYRLLTGQALIAQDYKHHVSIWRTNWPTVRRITDEILNWQRLTILESTPPQGVVNDAKHLIDANPLAPRDAFHLATLMRHGIPALVTADSDFDAVRLPDSRSLTVIKF